MGIAVMRETYVKTYVCQAVVSFSAGIACFVTHRRASGSSFFQHFTSWPPTQPLIFPPSGRRLDDPSWECSREAGGSEGRGEAAQAQAGDHVTVPGRLAGAREGGSQLPGQKTRVARLAGEVCGPGFHAAVGDEDAPPIGEDAFFPHRRDDFPHMQPVEVKLPIEEDAQWHSGILSRFEPDGSGTPQCPARDRLLDQLHEFLDCTTSFNTQRRKIEQVVHSWVAM